MIVVQGLPLNKVYIILDVIKFFKAREQRIIPTLPMTEWKESFRQIMRQMSIHYNCHGILFLFCYNSI